MLKVLKNCLFKKVERSVSDRLKHDCFLRDKQARWKLLILSLFQAAALLHDVSLGINMELTIVRIIRMLVQENEVYIYIYIDFLYSIIIVK